jgi:hypothetical protein
VRYRIEAEAQPQRDGAAVAKGTQLFGIERDVYQAQLDRAKAQLAKDEAVLAEAQTDLNRYQTLIQQNSIARQQAEDQAFVVQQDKATVDLDKANVENANINLGFTRVIAPFDGVVTRRLVDIGALVGASGPTTLAPIVQTDPIYVYFTVSEPQALALRGASRRREKSGASKLRTSRTFLRNAVGCTHSPRGTYVASVRATLCTSTAICFRWDSSVARTQSVMNLSNCGTYRQPNQALGPEPETAKWTAGFITSAACHHV